MTSDDETGDLVEDLAEELESFAFERERVLAKLDIRAATLARRIARELRVVLRGLGVASGAEARDGVMSTLGGLLEEAHRVLEDEPAPVIASSTAEDMSPAGDDDVPHESGTRPVDRAKVAAGGESGGGTDEAPDRATMESLPSVNLDPDEEDSPEDLTIARKVMWERSGNRILGR